MYIWTCSKYLHTHLYLEMERPPSEFLWKIGFRKKRKTHLVKTELGVRVEENNAFSQTKNKLSPGNRTYQQQIPYASHNFPIIWMSKPSERCKPTAVDQNECKDKNKEHP